MFFLPKNLFALPSLFLIYFLVPLFYPSLAFSQECYINIPSDQTLDSYCAQPGEANWNPTCIVQGNTCPGTKSPSGGTLGECWACVANPTQTPESCTSTEFCASLGYTITNGGLGRCDEPKVTCSGKRPDGCNYCVAPLCPSSTSCYNGDPNSDAGDVNCVPCSAITCSVTSATPTGPSTANASSAVTSGQADGYDAVNWYLNSNLIGTTAMNADGTASNFFNNLVPGTSYTLTSQYFDNQGGRPAVSCSGYTFQFNSPSSPMTCSLTASANTINVGDSVTWRLTSTPDGASAVWGGTNPDGTQVAGQVQGYSNATEWFDTYA